MFAALAQHDPRLIPRVATMIARSLLTRAVYVRTDRALPPSTVIARITDRCNLRCIQCGQWGLRGVYNDAHDRMCTPELDTTQWKRFITRVSRFCPHIYFFGGEPLLRPDLAELVATASPRMITGVNTNGTLLQHTAASLVDAGLHYIIVSLDGPHDINNVIRIGPGDAYESVISGVTQVAREKRRRRSFFPFIKICMTLTEENQGFIGETARIARSLGTDAFAVQHGIFTTEALIERSRIHYEQEFKVTARYWRGFLRDTTAMDPIAVAQGIAQARRIFKGFFSRYPSYPFDLKRYFHEPSRRLCAASCIIPWLHFQIMPQGDTALCEDFPDVIAGNVTKQDPSILWDNSCYRHFRHVIRTKGIFPACNRCCSYPGF